MEYRGIGVELRRERVVVNVPLKSTPGRGKEALENRASVMVDIFGVPVQDASFIFELKSILDEFIGKRLGQASGHLNSNRYALGDGYALSVFRKDAFLEIELEDTDTSKRYRETFNIIHAKTLAAILAKAIQSSTF